MERKLSEYIIESKKINSSDFESKIKIALLGSFTLDGLNETIKVKCSELKVGCDTFYGGYNRYNEEIEYGWWNISFNSVRISIIRNVMSGENE